MSLGLPLDTLSARWAEDPQPTTGAALADGLRKRGLLRLAMTVLGKGTERYPDHVPLWLTLARVAMDSLDHPACEAALRRALELDPNHPLVREMAGEVAPELLAAIPEHAPLPELAIEERDPLGEVDSPESAPEFVTESLAALYHRQGHLEMALTAYSELAARDPANATIAARQEAVRLEMASSRPVPFDARQSGGLATGPWLAQFASRVPARKRPTDFDAFYDPPPAPPEAVPDLGAFQRWLEELDK
jgi:tetratricopeptide (TPR) repeat protein